MSSSSSSSSSSNNSNKPDVASISSLLMNPQLMKDHIKRTTSTISSKCSSSSRGISSDTNEKMKEKNKDSSNKDSSSIHLPFDPDSVGFPYDVLYHENNSNEDDGDNNINLFSEIYSMAYASAGELYYYVTATIVLILVKMANNDSRNSNCFKKVQLLI